MRSEQQPKFKRRQLCLKNLGSSLLPTVAKLSQEGQADDSSVTVRSIAVRESRQVLARPTPELPKSLMRSIVGRSVRVKEQSTACINSKLDSKGSKPSSTNLSDIPCSDQICSESPLADTEERRSLDSVIADKFEDILQDSPSSKDNLNHNHSTVLQKDPQDQPKIIEKKDEISWHDSPSITSNPRIMLVHSDADLVAQLSAHLLLRVVGSSVVYAPDLDFAENLLSQQFFDVIVLGSNQLGLRKGVFHKALLKSKPAPVVIAIGSNLKNDGEIIASLGYKVIKALRASRTIDGCRPKGKIAMPLQHTKKQAALPTKAKIRSLNVDLLIGLPDSNQKIPDHLQAALESFSCDAELVRSDK